jgi:hypothetical protein
MTNVKSPRDTHPQQPALRVRLLVRRANLTLSAAGHLSFVICHAPQAQKIKQ